MIQKVSGLNISKANNWDGLFMGECPQCGCDLYVKGQLNKCANSGCDYSVKRK